MKRSLGDAITVLSGHDELTLAFMASGAEGVISVASNLVPREMSRMVRLAQGNDFVGATKLHQKLYPLFRALFVEPSPAPLKAALEWAGIIGSEKVRLPLCELSPASRAVLRKAVGALRR